MLYTFKTFYIIECLCKLSENKCLNNFLILVYLKIFSLFQIQKYNFEPTNLSRVSNILPILRYKTPLFNLLKVFLMAKRDNQEIFNLDLHGFLLELEFLGFWGI